MRSSLQLFVFLGVSVVGMSAQDAYRVGKQDQTIIHESAWLRVRRVQYQPGESVSMHEHKQRVVVFLTDGVVRSLAPDGKTTDAPFHRGLVNWSEPVKHALQNVGKSPLIAVEAELLGPHPPGAQAFIGDPLKQDPDHFRVEFENDSVRVLRFTLGPLERSPMHDQRDRITIRLSEMHSRTTFPDGKTEERRGDRDVAEWHDSARHTLENLDKDRYDSISIEFKSPQ